MIIWGGLIWLEIGYNGGHLSNDSEILGYVKEGFCDQLSNCQSFKKDFFYGVRLSVSVYFLLKFLCVEDRTWRFCRWGTLSAQFEILTPAAMEFTVLFDVTPYNLVQIYWEKKSGTKALPYNSVFNSEDDGLNRRLWEFMPVNTTSHSRSIEYSLTKTFRLLMCSFRVYQVEACWCVTSKLF
jgi:hypothetical protein